MRAIIDGRLVVTEDTATTERRRIHPSLEAMLQTFLHKLGVIASHKTLRDGKPHVQYEQNSSKRTVGITPGILFSVTTGYGAVNLDSVTYPLCDNLSLPLFVRFSA